jgi:transcriptional antiterminator NusG
MDMSDKAWHVVRGTPKVTGFISTGKKPTPLSEQEINEVVNRVSVTAEQPKPKFTFDHGDAVKIIDGPFKDFTGVVDDVNPDRNTLKVMLTILGRTTPVELESEQVEKV